MMWNGPYFGMMGWGGGWLGPFHFIIPLLFWAIVITAIVMLIRYTTGRGNYPWRRERRMPGLDALKERYARGEITRDEYMQKKRDIFD
jgi:putative membrane protein